MYFLKCSLYSEDVVFTLQASLCLSLVIDLLPSGVRGWWGGWDDAHGGHVEADGATEVSGNRCLTQIISDALQQREVLLI